MYPRLSSAPPASDDTDVYIFCAPASWRKNIRTLFYALGRGRNYSEDGDIRRAQLIGKDVAATLMMCNFNEITDELSGIKQVLASLSASVALLSQRNYCCRETDSDPSAYQPGDNPVYPPDYTPPPAPPGSEVPNFCQIGHAAVYRTKHILRKFVAILSAPEMDFVELRHALSDFGVPDNLNLIAAFTVYVYGLIVDALQAIIPAYRMLPGGVRALQDDGFALIDAIEQHRGDLACVFVQNSDAIAIQSAYNEILFGLTDNLLWRGLLWAAHYTDIFAQFLSARDPNSAIYGAFVNMPSDCCEPLPPVWVPDGSGFPPNQALCGGSSAVFEVGTESHVRVLATIDKGWPYNAYEFNVWREVACSSVTVTSLVSRAIRLEVFVGHTWLSSPWIGLGQSATLTGAIQRVKVKVSPEIYTAPCPVQYTLEFSVEYGY